MNGNKAYYNHGAYTNTLTQGPLMKNNVFAIQESEAAETCLASSNIQSPLLLGRYHSSQRLQRFSGRQTAAHCFVSSSPSCLLMLSWLQHTCVHTGGLNTRAWTFSNWLLAHPSGNWYGKRTRGMKRSAQTNNSDYWMDKCTIRGRGNKIGNVAKPMNTIPFTHTHTL